MFTHQSTLDVDIPNLGAARVTARTNGFTIAFPELVLFGKSYRDDVYVSADGKAIDISRFATFTDAARRRLTDVVLAWAPDWTRTDDAQALLAATVAHHNRINLDTVRRQLDVARNHVAQLEMIAEQIRAADPTEYVSPYTTTHRLVSNDR